MINQEFVTFNRITNSLEKMTISEINERYFKKIRITAVQTFHIKNSLYDLHNFSEFSHKLNNLKYELILNETNYKLNIRDES